MQEMDGIELALLLRAKYGKKAKIIMLSANSEDDIDPKLIDRPFDQYIMKPFQHSDLLNNIQKLLNINWTHQENNSSRLNPGFISKDKSQELALPLKSFDSLMKSARSGDIRALQTKLKEIKNESQTSYPVIDRLQNELNNFNLENFKAVLSENGDLNDTN